MCQPHSPHLTCLPSLLLPRSLILAFLLSTRPLRSTLRLSQGKLSEAVDALEPLRTKRDFALAAVHAMATFHRRAPRRDDSELESLEVAAEMAGEEKEHECTLRRVGHATVPVSP